MALIGYTRSGLPIYAIAGADDGPGDGSGEGADPDGGAGDGGGEGGEGGEGEGSDKGPDLEAEVRKWRDMARKHEKRAKANADAATKLQQVEDAKKSETERAAEKAAEAERRAADAEARALRYEVASDKGVPANLVKFLTGTTEEELEEQADELLTAVKPSGGDAGGKNESGEAGGKPARRPKEKLRPGATPSGGEPEETDPRKLAERIPRGFR